MNTRMTKFKRSSPSLETTSNHRRTCGSKNQRKALSSTVQITTLKYTPVRSRHSTNSRWFSSRNSSKNFKTRSAKVGAVWDLTIALDKQNRKLCLILLHLQEWPNKISNLRVVMQSLHKCLTSASLKMNLIHTN
jgi:hypothetical protein